MRAESVLIFQGSFLSQLWASSWEVHIPQEWDFTWLWQVLVRAGGTDHRSLLCPRALGITKVLQSWNLKNERYLRTWVHIRWGAELLRVWRRTQPKKAIDTPFCAFDIGYLNDWHFHLFSGLCKGWQGTDLLFGSLWRTAVWQKQGWYFFYAVYQLHTY